MVQFSVLLNPFSVLLYSSVLLCRSLLLILLCSSSCYVCVLDCIYCTLTLLPAVKPIAVNIYLPTYLPTSLSLSLSVYTSAIYTDVQLIANPTHSPLVATSLLSYRWRRHFFWCCWADDTNHCIATDDSSLSGVPISALRGKLSVLTYRYVRCYLLRNVTLRCRACVSWHNFLKDLLYLLSCEY